MADQRRAKVGFRWLGTADEFLKILYDHFADRGRKKNARVAFPTFNGLYPAIAYHVAALLKDPRPSQARARGTPAARAARAIKQAKLVIALRQRAVDMERRGSSRRAIARHLHVSPNTITRLLGPKRAQISRPLKKVSPH